MVVMRLEGEGAGARMDGCEGLSSEMDSLKGSQEG
jgi:hypothetical protein